MTRVRLLFSTLIAALLTGCATDAPYDYGLTLQVIRMDEQTRGLLATRPARPLPAAAAKSYVRESLGTLQLLHDRTVAHHVENPEAHLIEYLRRRFQALANRGAPPTRADIRRLAPAIADLRDSESVRGNDWRGAYGPVGFSSDDGLDFADDASYEGRHGDRGDRHEHGDDHDRRR